MICYDIKINSSPRGQNGHHFSDEIFKYIFMNETFFLNLIRIPLKCGSKGPTDNKSASVKVVAWRRIGDKLLPYPVLIKFTGV